MFGATHGKRRAVAAAAVIISTVLLGACEGEASPTGPNTNGVIGAINEIITSGPLNASSSDTLIAFNLETNSVVPKSGAWDILFRRYEIRLNSPATAGAATKNVTAYAVGNNKAKTDAQLLALSSDNTRAEFDALRSSAIPADNLFTTDKLSENKYAYLNLNGQPTANSANYWKVRTANGGYAVLHVTGITFTAQFALATVTIESRLQSGALLGAVRTLTVPTTSATTSISLVTNSVVTPNGCNWDFSINPSTFDLITNAACNAGTYPGGSSPTFEAVTTANDASQYALYLSSLGGPIPNSVTDVNAPFRYNLQNTNRLHPTFNTFLIKSGTKVYKLQVVNYYSASGDGGYPTIRAARIQ